MSQMLQKKKNVAFWGRVARLLEMHSERPQTQHPLHLASEKDWVLKIMMDDAINCSKYYCERTFDNDYFY